MSLLALLFIVWFAWHRFQGEWEHWNTLVSELVYPETATIDFGAMLVPNVDSVRIEYLINVIAKQGKVCLRWTIQLRQRRSHSIEISSHHLRWRVPSYFVFVGHRSAGDADWRAGLGQDGDDQRALEAAPDGGPVASNVQLLVGHHGVPVPAHGRGLRRQAHGQHLRTARRQKGPPRSTIVIYLYLSSYLW